MSGGPAGTDFSEQSGYAYREGRNGEVEDAVAANWMRDRSEVVTFMAISLMRVAQDCRLFPQTGAAPPNIGGRRLRVN